MGLMKDYNSAQVTVTFGPLLLTGFAKGSRVEITFPDQYTKQVGSDGEVMRSKSNDGTASVKVKLAQTSFSNDALSALHVADRIAPFGTGVFPFMIIDLNGTTLFSASQAWITKFPDASFDSEAGSREWTFDTGEVSPATIVGGNLVG